MKRQYLTALATGAAALGLASGCTTKTIVNQTGPCGVRQGVYEYTYTARGTGTCGFEAGRQPEGLWNFDEDGNQTNGPTNCTMSDYTVSDDECTTTFNQECLTGNDVARSTTQITWSSDGTTATAVLSATITVAGQPPCTEIMDGTAKKR